MLNGEPKTKLKQFTQFNKVLQGWSENVTPVPAKFSVRNKERGEDPRIGRLC